MAVSLFIYIGLRDIMSLRVKCNLGDDGCKWEGELRDLDKHLEKCSIPLSLCCCRMQGKIP